MKCRCGHGTHAHTPRHKRWWRWGFTAGECVVCWDMGYERCAAFGEPA